MEPKLPLSNGQSPNCQSPSSLISILLNDSKWNHAKTSRDDGKNIRKFIWNGKKGQIAWERAILPISEGGIGAPSVKIRYEAIKVDWLKRWWRPGPDRPDWAWVANEIIFQSAQLKPNIARSAVREWICQTWPIKTRSEFMTKSLKEMIEAARKYNAALSVMRAPSELRLEMPAFHHPFAKNKKLRTNSKTMRCLQEDHKAKTVRDLIAISTGQKRAPEATLHAKKGDKECRKKAEELLNRIEHNWKPDSETPHRLNLWHTPRRLKRNKEADPLVALVIYNPDTRTTHNQLGGIRIFGQNPGHKSKDRDPFQRNKSPARMNERIRPTGRRVTISTDGSATRNGWENAQAGIGVWYADGSPQNIALKLENRGENIASNSRAELGAILEALKQNEKDDLNIESDSLTSLRAICNLSEKYEDLNWSKVRNADLLKSILIRLRTRPARTAFKWVKGHNDNYGNNRADELANEGRESAQKFENDDEEWVADHPALQDGARLQALEAKHMYYALLKWHSRKVIPIPRQETLNTAKDSVEDTTNLHPTNERLLKGVKALGVPPRLKDHMRALLISRTKCGPFWNNIQGHAQKASCSVCKRRRGWDMSESEEHLWLQCEYNGQQMAWDTAKRIWNKSTDRDWPNISMGLIKGAPAMAFEHDNNKDSQRLKILISLTTWAIWKSRNKSTMNNEEISTIEAKETLKNLVTDLVRRSWNATKYMEKRRKVMRQNELRSLWAEDRLTNFAHKQGPIVDFT